MHSPSTPSVSPPTDAPLQALLLPLESGALAWPQDGALFLHAREGWPLRPFIERGLHVEQEDRAQADALERGGYALADPADTAERAMVLLLPPRQRDAARSLMARALDRCAEGGVVVASMANDAGAKSGERDLKALAGIAGVVSKYHCRVFWVRKDSAAIDQALLAQWRVLDVPRQVEAAGLERGRFLTRPGVFAWDRIDAASALLAAQLPGNIAGCVADLGAGWGYLSLEVLRRNPGVRVLDVYESDARALALARANLGEGEGEVAIDYHWHDVTAGLAKTYDAIVSNPPFHLHDGVDRPELGRRFIAVASAALRPGGRLYLVANRHLPYEEALATHFAEVRVLAQRNGFKAIEAIKQSARGKPR